MRRFTLILSLLIGFTMVAAACGSDDDDTTEVGSDDSEDTGSDDTSSEDTSSDPDTGAEDADTDAGIPLGAGPYPIADISVSVDLGNGTTAEYRLACLGDTATFTGDAGALDAGAACLALTDPEVRDRLTTEQHLDRICTEIYGGPEVAEISGTLDEQPVDTTISRSDGCGIDDWDRMLAALVPPAAS